MYHQAQRKPHLSRSWLNTNEPAPILFATLVETMWTRYAYAPLLHALGGHIVSCDEMTGIHALERLAPTKPMRPRYLKRREHAYKRHGTLSLIMNCDVVTGQGLAIAWPPRTEADCTAHMARRRASTPEAVGVFGSTQRHTHPSASLVRLVAHHGPITDDLGEKGKRGSLQPRGCRAAFLSDPSHRIADYNQTAKPFAWTYTGRPLVA